MFKYFFIISFVLMLLAGCKTASIFQESGVNSTQQVPLGSIGSGNDFLFQTGFNNAAIPIYNQPIKVAVKIIFFNKQTFKAFEKAKTLQSVNVVIDYIDSLAIKPKYIELQIADKVTVISALNLKENSDVKAYLGHNTYANVITSMSLALNPNDLESIIQADAVFLVEKTPKIYVLQLYKKNKKTGIIFFNQGVVFKYKTSNCCWQENKTHEINIVDLVSEYNNCPKRTHRSAKRAQKTINYFKL